MNIAFKEWAVVCDALGAGRQSVIIRKGGIAEGCDGFAFRHREFFLFPTRFHETLEKTTLPPGSPLPIPPEGIVNIGFAAQIEWSCFISDLKHLALLRDFHILHDQVLEERFWFGEPPGVHVGFAKVYQLSTLWGLPIEKRFGGCRSWVELPEAPLHRLEAVISDEENERRSRKLSRLLKQA
jgi:hypothetical protein